MVGTILLIDEVSQRSALAQGQLMRLGYRVLIAVTGSEARRILFTINPDCVLCSKDLANECGFDLIFDIRRHPNMTSVPMFLFAPTVAGEDHAQAFAAGALGILPLPLDIAALDLRLDALIRGHRLMADLDLHLPIDTHMGLAEASAAFDGPEPVLSVFSRDLPKAAQAICDDSQIHTHNTSALCTLAGSKDALETLVAANRTTVFVGENMSAEEARTVLGLGAQDVIDVATRPASLPAAIKFHTRLAAAKENRKTAIQDAFQNSRFDTVSGAYSRSYGETYLTRLLGNRRRVGTLGLILLDLDRFKAVNDRWGHRAGDQALRDAVAAITATLRPDSSVFSWGGDEFLITCPGLPPDKLMLFGDRVLDAVNLVTLPDQSQLSASFGGTCVLKNESITLSELLHRVDMALYSAKNAGSGRGAVA